MSLDDRQHLREAAAALTQARAAWDDGSVNLRATHEAAARKLVITLDPIAAARHHDARGRAVVDHVHDVLQAMRAVIDAALQPPRRALVGAANEIRSALGAADIPDRHWSSVAAAIRNDGRASPLVGGLPSADATVEEIHDWWTGQDDAARAEAIERFGDSLGRIDGISIPDRSQCNEARLPVERDRLRQEVADLQEHSTGKRRERRRIAALEEKIEGLDEIERRLAEERARGREAYLIDFETERYGSFRFSYGNPHTTRRVVTYVAGAGTSLGKAEGALEDSANLLEATERLHGGPDGPHDTAVITNVYQIKKPLALSILGMSVAKAGASALARFQHGLRVTHAPLAEGEDAVRYVGAHHSYGNILAAEAARASGYAVDAFTVNGVGWTGLQHADELGVPEVYSTLMETDPLRVVRRIRVRARGPQPANEEFGATTFASGPGPTGWLPGGTSMDSHFAYLDDPLTLLNNAEIILGNPPHHTEVPAVGAGYG